MYVHNGQCLKLHLFQRSVQGSNPFLHFLSLDSLNKGLKLSKQVIIPLKVIVVEIHPMSKYIKHSTVSKNKDHTH